jgi:hypothetical protein
VVALDEQTREPLPAVAIHLIDAAGSRLLAVLTDAQDRFQITAPGPGRYRIRGERLGYFATQSAELSGEALSRLVELRMSPRPVRLDSILVSARSEAPRLRAGEQLIHGRMIDEETHSTIPGATVELYSKGKREQNGMEDFNNRLKRYSNSGFGDFITRDSLAAYERDRFSTRRIIELHLFRASLGCTPGIDVYVNGAPFLLEPSSSGTFAQKIDDAFAPGGLEAIEVYTAPKIPGEFSIPRLRGASTGNRYGPPCNVIALWTRR